jgi:hypothetical protein
MSNIAGKAYAMNLVTPLTEFTTEINKAVFFAIETPFFRDKLKGLLTLSMIHYARWSIVRASEFPHVSHAQPVEELNYNYMFFFSNFNGSWAQYVDSFSAAIPDGLNSLWHDNIGWPNAVPQQPFHRYVNDNQLWTNHYYSAYPIAASNDVKAARHVKDELRKFVDDTSRDGPEQFSRKYNTLLKTLQDSLSCMAETPIVSLAHQAVVEQCRADEGIV